MPTELYIGRVPAGASFFYVGRVYELPRGQSTRTVRAVLGGVSWTEVLTAARKITLEQKLEILRTEPDIPGVFALRNQAYEPLPQRDFDFLVEKAAKLAKRSRLY
jgi:hypothetical protein